VFTPTGSVHGCNIVDCGIYAFYLSSINDATTVIDATFNWWGAADSASIEAVVFHHADSSLFPVLDYVPFADSPFDFAFDGACCLDDGTCIIAGETICSSLAGYHQGYGTHCLGDNDHNGSDDACESCCIGRVGDANGLGGDEPTIGDISVMIDAKFITGVCNGIIACLAEADINHSGGLFPTCDDVTIGDISVLIDYLFITGPSLGLAECL